MTLNAKNAKFIRKDDVEHWDVSETSRAGTTITRRGYFTTDAELERLVEAENGRPTSVAQVVWIFEGTDYERAARGALAFARIFIEKFYADRGYSADLVAAQRDAVQDPN